jgi:hypothetical protein
MEVILMKYKCSDDENSVLFTDMIFLMSPKISLGEDHNSICYSFKINDIELNYFSFMWHKEENEEKNKQIKTKLKNNAEKDYDAIMNILKDRQK